MSNVFVFAQTKEDLSQAMENAIDRFIKKAEPAALNSLRSKKEFQYLYNTKHPDYKKSPENDALIARMESAVIALANSEEIRKLIRQGIISVCEGLGKSIDQCDDRMITTDQLKSVIADSIINSFAEARNNGTEQLDALIAFTEAHTAQNLAIDGIVASIKQLEDTKNTLKSQRDFINKGYVDPEEGWIDGYIQQTEKKFENLNFIEKFIARTDVEAGILDLHAIVQRIGSMLEDVNKAIYDLERIKNGIERGTIKPAEVAMLFNGIKNDLILIAKNENEFLLLINRPGIRFIVREYNGGKPKKPINLDQIGGGIVIKFKPLYKAIEFFATEEAKNKMDKLRESLGIKGVNPKLPLTQNLKDAVPCVPRPSMDKPRGTITGVTDADGKPIVIIDSPKKLPSKAFRDESDKWRIYKKIDGILYIFELSDVENKWINGVEVDSSGIPINKSASQ